MFKRHVCHGLDILHVFLSKRFRVLDSNLIRPSIPIKAQYCDHEDPHVHRVRNVTTYLALISDLLHVATRSGKTIGVYKPKAVNSRGELVGSG